MNPKKALTWAGVALVVFFGLSSPTDPKGVVDSAFGGIESAANAVADFVKSVV